MADRANIIKEIIQDIVKERVEKGKTYNAIGRELENVTEEAVKETIKKRKRSWKTDTWRSYKRHYYHVKVNKQFDDCERCQDASRKTLEN